MVEAVATTKAIIARDAAVAEYWTKYDTEINNRIEKAVTLGQRECTIDLEKLPYHIYNPVTKSLKKHFRFLGYKVYCRGRFADYTYIKISWRNEQSQKRYRWYNPFSW